MASINRRSNILDEIDSSSEYIMTKNAFRSSYDQRDASNNKPLNYYTSDSNAKTNNTTDRYRQNVSDEFRFNGGLDAASTAAAAPLGSGGIYTGYANSALAGNLTAQSLNLNFDSQLRALQLLQSQLATDFSPAPVVRSDTCDPELIIDRIMAENLQREQKDRDARMEEYSRSRSREIFRGLWNAYHLTLADDFGAAPLRSVTGPSTLPLLAAEEGSRQTALQRLLSSSTPMAAELNGKIASFAATVNELPAADWVYHFASYVAENTRRPKDEMEVLWATVDLLLRAYQRKGSGATMLSYVAASRQLMERKALSALFLSQRIEPGRLDALANTTTERVRQIMLNASGNQNVWQQMYTAMRIGRYDVAEEIALHTGNQALQAALKNYAQATAEERQRMPPQVDLQSLYAQEPTRTDAYRQAVLFLLLNGHTGEDEKLQTRTLYAICTNVTNSVEDILWLRLACVRTTEENTNADAIQALGYTQRILLDDFQSLLTAMQDNVPRIASFLFHAALPSSGLRLMLDNDVACIDGFHLALCFHNSDLLQRSAYAETPIDVARYLRWYCSSILLNADLRLRDVVNAGMTMFQYFQKTNSVAAFVQLCQEERICYRLFGQKGVLGGNSALLMNEIAASRELRVAMNQIAAAAAKRNHSPMAVHVWLVLSYMCNVHQNTQEARPALAQACLELMASLAQIFSQPPTARHVEGILVEAELASRMLDVLGYETLSEAHQEAFHVLLTLKEVYRHYHSNAVEAAVHSFFQLPLIPATSQQIDEYVLKLQSASRYTIQGLYAVMPKVALSAKGLLQLYQQQGGSSTSASANELWKRMRVVSAWYKRCCQASGPTIAEFPQELEEFDQPVLL